MTIDPARLLQMLEPAVRPGNASASAVGGAQQGKPAFEARSFDDLLLEAKARGVEQTKASQTQAVQIDPLGVLGGFGQVENAALRNVLAQARGLETDLGKTG